MSKTNQEIKTERAEQSISAVLGIQISNFGKHADGFSFTVQTEFEAYKAAYKYRYSKRVYVTEAPNVKAWLVQVWNR